MNVRKITEDEIRENSVASLSTRPNEGTGYGRKGLSADELKAAFDALGRLNAMRYNELVEALENGEYQTGNDADEILPEDMVTEEDLAQLRSELLKTLREHASEGTAHRGMTAVTVSEMTAKEAKSYVRFANGSIPTAAADGDILTVNTGNDLVSVRYAGGCAEVESNVTIGSNSGVYIPIAVVPVLAGKTYAFYVKEKVACTETNYDLVLSLSETETSLYDLFAISTEQDVDTRFPIIMQPESSDMAVLYWHLRAGATIHTKLVLTPSVYTLQNEGVYKIEDGGENSVSALFGHAFGHRNKASGFASFAAGEKNTASGICSFASGRRTVASGDMSHAEGMGSQAKGKYAHAENCYTVAGGKYSHAEGHSSQTYANESENLSANYSHAEGYGSVTMGHYAHAEGYQCDATSTASHAEGQNTTASGKYSHSQGLNTTASGYASHAMGNGSSATGSYAFAGGVDTLAYGANSMAFGSNCVANGRCSFVNGASSSTKGAASFAIGDACSATGEYSMAAGNGSTALGSYSAARGKGCQSTGAHSFTHGLNLIAPMDNQVVFGSYNVEDANAVFQIGGGTANSRKDLFSVRNKGGLVSICLGNTEITETQLQALLLLIKMTS